MYKDQLLPIIVASPIYIDNNNIAFLRVNDKSTITTSDSDILWKILGACNGNNSIADIASIVGVDIALIKTVIEQLMSLDIIIDSRQLYLHFHRICNYPTTYVRTLTQDEIEQYRMSPRIPCKTGNSFAFDIISSPLNNLISRRRSCRAFSDKKITLNIIGNICFNAYSLQNHCVPSGGALYPLKIYVIAEKDQIDFPSGYYEYDSELNKLVLYSSNVDIDQLKHCFNDENMAFDSPIQIIIAADLNRQTYKYSNRGYRLTLIEAGQVAQNISLYCEEQQLGTCELGGLIDDAIKEELDFPREIYPLLGLALGYPASKKEKPFNEMAFVEENIKRFELNNNSYGLVNYIRNNSFFGAIAKYGTEPYQTAGATSASSNHAIFKAVIEAYERKVSCKSIVDIETSALELTEAGLDWIDPREINPLSQVQAKKCGVKYFIPSLKIQWTKGYSFNKNKEIYIPTDIVYYGHKYGNNPIYIGNSSGIAAYTNQDTAIKKAVLELIERDAIMRCWFSQNSPVLLSQDLLSIHLKKRIRSLSKEKRTVFMLEIPSNYAEVILAVIVSDIEPCFVCGASAVLDDTELSFFKAANKALQEAEFCLYSSLRFPSISNADAIESITSPTDHGNYYHKRENVDKIQWLWQGSLSNQRIFKSTYSYLDLLNILDISYVLINRFDNFSPVFIVKAISPKLIPINFGINSYHYLHPALAQVNIDPNSLILPHFFA